MHRPPEYKTDAEWIEELESIIAVHMDPEDLPTPVVRIYQACVANFNARYIFFGVDDGTNKS